MRISRSASTVLVALLAFAVACDVTTQTAPVDSDIGGIWVLDEAASAGQIVFTTTDSMGVVTGRGDWSNSTGRGGSLGVSGTVAHDSLRLRLILSFSDSSLEALLDPLASPLSPDTGTFVGAFVSRDEFDGTLVLAGNSQVRRFLRRSF